MRNKSIVAVFVAICLLLLGSGWCLAEEIKLQSGETIRVYTPKANEAEVKAFWTKERLFQALQNPMTKEILTEDLKLTLDVATSALDEPKLAPGYCPDCPENQSNYGDLFNPPSESAVSNEAPCPASDYSWAYDYENTRYPERVNGRLFFTTDEGFLAVCSASLINRRQLLTAGHCVSNGNGAWFSNFYFIPGFKDGEQPFGQGYLDRIFVFINYFETGIWSHDFAMAILTTDMGESLGYLGFAAGWDPADLNWLQFGYPAQEPFDGNWLVTVLSALGYRVSGIGDPYPCAVGSIFTQGASGGPWMILIDDNLYANGVNSAKPVSCGETTISPYFGADAWDMYEYVRDRQ